jgi:hypothetical protein
MAPALRPGLDLTQRGGNISAWIEQNYARLMDQNTDPQEIIDLCTTAAKHFRGRSLGEGGFVKFVRTLQQVAEKGLTEIQKYLTNYMLAGAGMRADAGVREPQRDYAESIEGIANMISEEIEPVFTLKQKRLKMLVESYGYNVWLTD